MILSTALAAFNPGTEVPLGKIKAAGLAGYHEPVGHPRCLWAVLRFVFLAVVVLSGCGNDDATMEAGGSASTAAHSGQSPATSGSGGEMSGGSADCAAVEDALSKVFVNWQMVQGFAKHRELSDWADSVKRLGTLPRFGEQLDVLENALGEDQRASRAIAFMRGANAIVQKGLGGDDSAPADLARYLGSDDDALVSKYAWIGLAPIPACGQR